LREAPNRRVDLSGYGPTEQDDGSRLGTWAPPLAYKASAADQRPPACFSSGRAHPSHKAARLE
jgi:hypothetical protein